MARLRDIKVGMTVWIKKGKTPLEQFGVEGMEQHIGESSTVGWVDSSANDIGVFEWSWPADWISLTPPKDASKEASKEAPKKKLYVAVSGYEVTEPGTFEEVVNFLQNCWDYTNSEVATTKIYELREVQIKFTPVKFEVVE